jgi:hypothetical protein
LFNNWSFSGLRPLFETNDNLTMHRRCQLTHAKEPPQMVIQVYKLRMFSVQNLIVSIDSYELRRPKARHFSLNPTFVSTLDPGLEDSILRSCEHSRTEFERQ